MAGLGPRRESGEGLDLQRGDQKMRKRKNEEEGSHLRREWRASCPRELVVNRAKEVLGWILAPKMKMDEKNHQSERRNEP